MDLVLPLITFVLIAGGQGNQHASFADAATTTATSMEALTAYWEAALPGIPVPPAIRDLLAQQKGLRKIGPNYERVHIISEMEDDLKEAHGSYGEEGIVKAMVAHETNIGKDLKRQPMSHGLHATNYVEEKNSAHRKKNRRKFKGNLSVIWVRRCQQF